MKNQVNQHQQRAHLYISMCVLREEARGCEVEGWARGNNTDTKLRRTVYKMSSLRGLLLIAPNVTYLSTTARHSSQRVSLIVHELEPTTPNRRYNVELGAQHETQMNRERWLLLVGR